MDLSKMQKPKELRSMGKQNWLIIVYERTDLKFSSFRATKNGAIDPTCRLLQKFKNKGKTTKHVRCDNVGEKKSLDAACNGNKWNLFIRFEHAASHAPSSKIVMLKMDFRPC